MGVHVPETGDHELAGRVDDPRVRRGLGSHGNRHDAVATDGDGTIREQCATRHVDDRDVGECDILRAARSLGERERQETPQHPKSPCNAVRCSRPVQDPALSLGMTLRPYAPTPLRPYAATPLRRYAATPLRRYAASHIAISANVSSPPPSSLSWARPDRSAMFLSTIGSAPAGMAPVIDDPGCDGATGCDLQKPAPRGFARWMTRSSRVRPPWCAPRRAPAALARSLAGPGATSIWPIGPVQSTCGPLSARPGKESAPRSAGDAASPGPPTAGRPNGPAAGSPGPPGTHPAHRWTAPDIERIRC